MCRRDDISDGHSWQANDGTRGYSVEDAEADGGCCIGREGPVEEGKQCAEQCEDGMGCDRVGESTRRVSAFGLSI